MSASEKSWGVKLDLEARKIEDSEKGCFLCSSFSIFEH